MHSTHNFSKININVILPLTTRSQVVSSFQDFQLLILTTAIHHS